MIQIQKKKIVGGVMERERENKAHFPKQRQELSLSYIVLEICRLIHWTCLLSYFHVRLNHRAKQA
jgi:hypothetical protein